jgi:hypothetical protein
MENTLITVAYFLGMFTILFLQLALHARASLKELEGQLEKERTENKRRATKEQDPNTR